MRLSFLDVVRVGGAGLRTRPLRVFLSALGIAIGIAAMVAVVGISTSSRAQLDRQLDALGTNLLSAGPGKSFFGDASHLPSSSVAMVARIGPVTSVSSTGRAPNRRGEPWRHPNAYESGTCVHCGNCVIGCEHGAKKTLDKNYLATARPKNGAR